MKKFFSFFFLFISISLFSIGLPHAVYFQVYATIDSSVVYPDSITFNAWITDREDEVLTEKSFGCGFYKDHSLAAVQVGNFPTPWKAGELLNIEVESPLGYGFRTIELTNESAQFFVKDYQNDYGLPLKPKKEDNTNIKEYAKIYPNPFKNEFSILYHLNGTAKLTIRDAQGNIVLDKNISNKENKMKIEAKDYKLGVYELEIKSQTFDYKMKIIKID